MSWEVWLAYVATVLVLMSTPGPSHLLMLANSMSHGFRPALATAAGDLSANTLQMLAAGLGLASVIFASETAFLIVKWGGVAYLVWMGLDKIRKAGRARIATGADAPRISRRKLYMQGFVTSAANPKAVVFFAALFPLFLNADAPLAPQLAILGATYIAIDGTFLCTYGGFAAWLARILREKWKVWLDRFAGLGLIAAAVLLGFKQVTRQA